MSALFLTIWLAYIVSAGFVGSSLGKASADGKRWAPWVMAAWIGAGVAMAAYLVFFC